MFGGQELNELFVTSARVGLSEKDLTRQPHAGDVFSIKTNVKGILEPYFTG